MRTPVDTQLRQEAARFAFRFACEDCAHYDECTACCSLGFPAAPRREALREPQVQLCKAFELV